MEHQKDGKETRINMELGKCNNSQITKMKKLKHRNNQNK